MATRDDNEGPAKEAEEDGMTIGELRQALTVALQRGRYLNQHDGSRELSLSITKIEEAIHWLDALPRPSSTPSRAQGVFHRPPVLVTHYNVQRGPDDEGCWGTKPPCPAWCEEARDGWDRDVCIEK